jgi:hypothetical protein
VCEAPGTGSLALQWVAPGDDGVNGTASAYDVRYGYRWIDESNWNDATPIAAAVEPKAAGQPVTLIVTVPTPNRNYAFALKAADEVPHWSDVSNNALGLGYQSYLFTLPDIVQAGGNLTAVYRAPGGVRVRAEMSAGCIHPCGQGQVILASSVLPEGIYTLTYDFYRPDEDDYWPSGWYHIRVCGDGQELGYDRVQFVR